MERRRLACSEREARKVRNGGIKLRYVSADLFAPLRLCGNLLFLSMLDTPPPPTIKTSCILFC